MTRSMGIGLTFALSVSVMSLCAQSDSKAGKASDLLSADRLPSSLSAAYRALGKRLSATGKERVVATGNLTDISGTRSVQLIWQIPGVFRFEEGGQAGRVITFNGNQLTKSRGTLAEDDRRIVESLVLDSAVDSPEIDQ